MFGRIESVIFDLDGVLVDSPAGVNSAKAAGTYVIAVTNTSEPEKLKVADRTAGSTAEAIRIVAELLDTALRGE